MAEGRAEGSDGIQLTGTPTMVNIQDLDHYDFINAPQYVDFCDLSRSDDPNAEMFFETHREEDDFLISIDNISPTVQFLAEQQNNIKKIEEEAAAAVNEAAIKMGMDDVQVTYYASPSTMDKTNNRKTASLNSTVGSFHTPMGDDSGNYNYAYDKENYAPVTPIIPSPNNENGFMKDKDTAVKKLSYSAALNIKTDMLNNMGFTIKDENLHNNQTMSAKSYKSMGPPLRDSLLSQLEKLQILSSDEEDAAVVVIEEQENISYNSPTKSPINTEDGLVDKLLKTPGALVKQPKKKFLSAISDQKRDFFEGLSISSPNPIDKDENVEEFYKNEFPVFQGPVDGDDRKQSFLVDASVGKEVVWNQQNTNESQHEEQVQLGQGDATETPSAGSKTFEIVDDDGESNVTVIDSLDLNALLAYEEGDAGADADDTLTSSFDAYQSGGFCDDHQVKPKESSVVLRRTSSLSDLSRVLNENQRKQANSHKQKFAIQKLTIPQSPDASKRPPRLFRSAAKGEQITIPTTKTNTKSSAAVQSKKSTYAPPVPYKAAVAGGSRGPLKASHYVSMAEAITKFQKNTPDRFRSLPRGRVPISMKRSASCEIKPQKLTVQNEKSQSPCVSPTVAKAKALLSRSRAVSTSNSSRPRVRIPSGNSAKASIPPPRATIPQPFHFSTIRPRTNTNEAEKKDVPDFKFKARPAPKVSAPLAGLQQRPQIKVTMPIAPHFASDDRIRERNKKAQSEKNHSAKVPSASTSAHVKTSKIPTTMKPPTPDIPKSTSIKPFSFDQRNQEMLRRKEQKIKQELEEEMKFREFHANPLPKFDGKLPTRKPHPPTHVEPFHLKSDERGFAYQEALKRKLQEEERQLRELATFHAKSPVVLHQPAFEPEHPPRVPLEPLDVHLYTEKRAVEREQFDCHLKQKELEEEERRREEQIKLEEIRKQEEIERRRQIVHKAQPFKIPKAFELKSTKKVLTIPQSPAFNPLPSQRQRIHNKMETPM